MALEVEDGTGKADAESFISVADATAYHAARGNASWAALASDTEREQYLRKATDYIGQVYGQRWAGARVTDEQALDWPRDLVPRPETVTGELYWPDDEVPVAVRNACAELALKAIDGDLAPDVERTTKREKLGPLEVEYSDAAAPFTLYRAIDNMLAPFLNSAGSGAFRQVVRT